MPRPHVSLLSLVLNAQTEARRLGWMELCTTLAKLFFMYDVELVDKEVDWHEKSEMHFFWRKPDLVVKLHRRKAQL